MAGHCPPGCVCSLEENLRPGLVEFSGLILSLFLLEVWFTPSPIYRSYGYAYKIITRYIGHNYYTADRNNYTIKSSKLYWNYNYVLFTCWWMHEFVYWHLCHEWFQSFHKLSACVKKIIIWDKNNYEEIKIVDITVSVSKSIFCLYSKLHQRENISIESHNGVIIRYVNPQLQFKNHRRTILRSSPALDRFIYRV